MNGVPLLRIAMIAVAIGLGSIVAASNEPPNSTPQEVFNGMRQSFQADKAKGVHLRYQWQLSGPNGGEWWIEVNDGEFEMGRGKLDKPDVTFVTRDAPHVACARWLLRVRTLELQRDVARRFIHWAVILGRAQIVE